GPPFRARARRRAGRRPVAHDRGRLDRAGDGRSRVAIRHRDDRDAFELHGAGAGGRDRGSFSNAYVVRDLVREAMTHIDTHTAQTLTLTHRLRRLRRTETMRALVRETRLSPDMFVLPLFVCEGEGVRREVPSMPGVCNLSVDEAVKEAQAAKGDGVKSVILFGLPDHKDDIGSMAYDPEGPVQAATRAIKREAAGVLVMTDVCLCEYTDHGHCGIVIDEEIANDPTVDQLVRAAVSHAGAGADIVAPSDMMDGRVGAIRKALDDRGFEHTAIMAYAAKYCSAFYGPFRDAAA